MYHVEVFHNIHAFERPAVAPFYAAVGTIQTDAATVEEALDMAFRLSQNIDTAWRPAGIANGTVTGPYPRTPCRSTSVGDLLYVVETNENYHVSPIGFTLDVDTVGDTTGAPEWCAF